MYDLKRNLLSLVMTAIAPEERGAHIAMIKKLFGLVQSTRELPNGYAFEIPNESDVLFKAAKFIVNERLCCPFFDFALEIEREGGPMWLCLKGRDGVKPFIMAEVEYLPFNAHINKP